MITALRLLLVLLLLAMVPLGRSAEMGETRRARLEQLLAAFSDARKTVHRPAMQALARFGPQALADLALFADDPDPALRARLAVVIGGIVNDEAVPLLISLARDSEAQVREKALLGLGTAGHDAGFSILVEALQDPRPPVRESAALGLGALGNPRALRHLAWWHLAGGHIDRLELSMAEEREALLERVRQAMRASLDNIASQHASVPEMVRLLDQLSGQGLVNLIRATWRLGDPRLSPALAKRLSHSDPEVVEAAALALGANGDSRALAALCRTAAASGMREAADAAAQTLRRLTGYHAGPGRVWQRWWQEHAVAVEALHERDALIATWHDVTHPVTAADLAAYDPQDLMPLVDGVLGGGPPYWGGRALAILRRDDPGRWLPVLLHRYDRSRGDEVQQIALVLLIDELSPPGAKAALRERRADLLLIRPAPGQRHRHGSLLAALALAIERQQQVTESRLLR